MEVVVSLALLGFIVALVLNIFPSSIIASHDASEQIDAEHLAQSFLEESRSVSFSSLTPGTELLPSPDPRFQVEREVFVPAGADADQTVGVRIAVRWESKRAKEKVMTRELWVSSIRG
jgi:type II secretory pathway pseudopilin PulG